MGQAERNSGSSPVAVLPETTVKDKFRLTSEGFDRICEALGTALEKIRNETIQPPPEVQILHERS